MQIFYHWLRFFARDLVTDGIPRYWKSDLISLNAVAIGKSVNVAEQKFIFNGEGKMQC